MPAPTEFLSKPTKALAIVLRVEVWIASRLKGSAAPEPPPGEEPGGWILETGIWDDSGLWDDAETWNDGV